MPINLHRGRGIGIHFFNLVKKFEINPQCSSTLNRYACAILSNTSALSRVRRHVGEFVLGAARCSTCSASSSVT